MNTSLSTTRVALNRLVQWLTPYDLHVCRLRPLWSKYWQIPVYHAAASSDYLLMLRTNTLSNRNSWCSHLMLHVRTEAYILSSPKFRTPVLITTYRFSFSATSKPWMPLWSCSAAFWQKTFNTRILRQSYRPIYLKFSFCSISIFRRAKSPNVLMEPFEWYVKTLSPGAFTFNSFSWISLRSRPNLQSK